MVTARGHCYHHSALRIPGEVVQVRLAPLLPRNFAEELKDASFHTKVLERAQDLRLVFLGQHGRRLVQHHHRGVGQESVHMIASLHQSLAAPRLHYRLLTLCPAAY